MKKAIALAEYRLAEIKKSAKPHEEIQEFKEFSWWVSSESFDDKWALGALHEALSIGCDLEGDHLVVERFIELAPKYPVEVISILELMVENDQKGWGVPTWGDDLSNVIQMVLDSKNDEAIEKAKDFIQRLVAKGHIQYQQLLPKEK